MARKTQLKNEKCCKFDKISSSELNFDEILDTRMKNLEKEHKNLFSTTKLDFYSASGRIEIVGNHTDHNGGKVLCASINYDTLASVSKTDDKVIKIVSNGYPLIKVDLNNLEIDKSEYGSSKALVKGVAKYYINKGFNVGGFCAVMTSDVPKGSGVSSSSSFELIIAEIFNCIYNCNNVNKVEKAKASQFAEKFYFGKPCGLMDQMAISLGGVNLIDFADFENPNIKSVDWSFDDLSIFIIATGGDHSNLTNDYALIPKEMKDVANYFGVDYLYQLDKNKFYDNKNKLEGSVCPRAILRAEHFFEETERVEKTFKAIENKDKQAFLDCVNQSGLSSKFKLQNLYSETAKNHNLENALTKVENIDGVLAKRVHGGGFAGTILVFVDKNKKVFANQKFVEIFGKNSVFEMEIRQQGAFKLEEL